MDAMGFLSGKRIKQDFIGARSAQSDDDFLARCELNRGHADAAIRVRAAIATLAGVEPGYVHAEDTFDGDLAHFDFWGSLDSVAIVLELEKQMGIPISDEQAQRIVDPESVRDLTVAQFVRSVLEAVPGNGVQ